MQSQTDLNERVTKEINKVSEAIVTSESFTRAINMSKILNVNFKEDVLRYWLLDLVMDLTKALDGGRIDFDKEDDY